GGFGGSAGRSCGPRPGAQRSNRGRVRDAGDVLMHARFVRAVVGCSRPLGAGSFTLVVTAGLCAAACTDSGKIAEREATEEIARLVPLVKEDVEQVRRGLPEGSAKLGALLEPDVGMNLVALQKAIQTARAQVKDLDVAKSTFFSFADPSGVVLRSESDPDLLAGKSVVAAFPLLKKALEPASGNVEVFGEMTEMRGVKAGPDQQWVVAH